MADRNGYNKSIMATEAGRCYVCRAETETVRHEIYYGTKNRKISKINGFWLDVCPTCHRRIHAVPGKGFDKLLKQKCQKNYEAFGTRDGFRRLVGRSYL